MSIKIKQADEIEHILANKVPSFSHMGVCMTDLGGVVTVYEVHDDASRELCYP